MALAPYDPAAGGPSQAAAIDTMAYTDAQTDAANRQDLATQRTRLTGEFNSQTMPQLKSSLGANGQLYSTAASNAVTQAGTQYQNQQADLQTAFNRAHMDLKRQEAFAAIGLII